MGVFTLYDDEIIFVGIWNYGNETLHLDFSNYEPQVKKIELFDQDWLKLSFSNAILELQSFNEQAILTLKIK